ncbi:MAG: Lrp/AsnC family transcriptional regulator [Christensenellaceae bacterium]|nr:Lrp/AsnC family transcriptional regulator [Christensenellaceae bacterium]
MDNIDRKLLDLLAENARTSLKQLAEQVFLSSPAVSARIEHLEKQGILKGYTTRLDGEKLGLPVAAYIYLDVAAGGRDQALTLIEECANVVECDCITGNYALLIKAAFADTQQLDGFVRQLQKFGKTHTELVFSTPVERRAPKLAFEEEV